MGNLLTTPISKFILQGMMSALQLEEDELGYMADGGEEKGKNRHRDRGFAPREVSYLTDAQFRTMFRMSRASFEKLLELIEPFMPV